MKIYHECLPCHLRTAVNSVMTMTEDESIISEVVEKCMQTASRFRSYDSLLEIYYDIQKVVKDAFPGMDPFSELKQNFNKLCMDSFDEYIKKINDSSDRFETALKLCLAGNSIDVMQGIKMNHGVLIKAIENALKQPLNKKVMEKLKSALQKSSNILFIGDNAGEIVFDRIFIDYINSEFNKAGHITYAVRGSAALNDVTIKDALMVGMDKSAKVITTGIDMPAAYLPYCSKEFNEAYDAADCIISKGQGNLEALLEENKNIFFLLKIKCNVIAKILDHKYKVDEVVIEAKTAS